MAPSTRHLPQALGGVAIYEHSVETAQVYVPGPSICSSEGNTLYLSSDLRSFQISYII